MKFRPRSTLYAHQTEMLSNEDATICLVLNDYAFGQVRIQVERYRKGNATLFESGECPPPDIELELGTYVPERAREALRRLQAALDSEPDFQKALTEVVLSYGGNPFDSRQRLDTLIDGTPQYWKE
jgi:hypothetical protein